MLVSKVCLSNNYQNKNQTSFKSLEQQRLFGEIIENGLKGSRQKALGLFDAGYEKIIQELIGQGYVKGSQTIPTGTVLTKGNERIYVALNRGSDTSTIGLFDRIDLPQAGSLQGPTALRSDTVYFANSNNEVTREKSLGWFYANNRDGSAKGNKAVLLSGGDSFIPSENMSKLLIKDTF